MPSPISVWIAGQPGFGAGHLDHQVAPVDLVPEPPRLLDRRVRVHRQIGRDLEADEAVAALRLLVDRVELVRSFLDVADRQILEERSRIEVARSFRRRDQRVVIIAVADRLLEDRRVRGDAAQPVLGDHPGQLSGLQQFSADKVEPDRLPEFLQCPQWIWHHVTPCARAAPWRPRRRVRR